MFLLRMKGRVSARVRGDVSSRDLTEQIAQSLRGVGLGHVDMTEDRVSFRRNFTIFGAAQRFSFLADRGDFLVRLDRRAAAVYYDISLAKLWAIILPLTLLLAFPVWTSMEVNILDKCLISFGFWLWMFGVQYIVLLVLTRIFLGRLLHEFSA